MLRFLTLCLLVGVFTALAVPDARAQAPVVSTWESPVKLADGTEAVYRYELTFDYVSNTATQVAYDASGQIVASEAVPPPPMPTDPEIAAATALIEADAEFAAFLAEPGVILDGGYILYDGACATARCLQFTIGPATGERADRFVVVNLSAHAIAERDFYPELRD